MWTKQEELCKTQFEQILLTDANFCYSLFVVIANSVVVTYRVAGQNHTHSCDMRERYIPGANEIEEEPPRPPILL